jgi:hypothetical protein
MNNNHAAFWSASTSPVENRYTCAEAVLRLKEFYSTHMLPFIVEEHQA